MFRTVVHLNVQTVIFNNAANTIINGNSKVGASVFGQRYSKVGCSSCNIDNSTKSHQQLGCEQGTAICFRV